MTEKINKLVLKMNPKSGHVRLVPISCLHVGHRKFNKPKAQGFLDYVLNTEDTYALMLGDTTENVLSETAARHPGAIHDQVLSVEEQRTEALKLLSPLAEKKKILSWNESNHSLRSWYQAGFSVEQWLATKLDVPFMGTDSLLEIKVGKQTYFVHSTHGVGSSTSLQSVFGKLMAQASRVVNADVYIRGHHHKKLLGETCNIDGKTGRIKKKILAATGCFMNYVDGYGHRKELTPIVPGCVKVKLYADKWDIHATL